LQVGAQQPGTSNAFPRSAHRGGDLRPTISPAEDAALPQATTAPSNAGSRVNFASVNQETSGSHVAAVATADDSPVTEAAHSSGPHAAAAPAVSEAQSSSSSASTRAAASSGRQVLPAENSQPVDISDASVPTAVVGSLQSNFFGNSRRHEVATQPSQPDSSNDSTSASAGSVLTSEDAGFPTAVAAGPALKSFDSSSGDVATAVASTAARLGNLSYPAETEPHSTAVAATSTALAAVRAPPRLATSSTSPAVDNTAAPTTAGKEPTTANSGGSGSTASGDAAVGSSSPRAADHGQNPKQSLAEPASAHLAESQSAMSSPLTGSLAALDAKVGFSASSGVSGTLEPDVSIGSSTTTGSFTHEPPATVASSPQDPPAAVGSRPQEPPATVGSSPQDPPAALRDLSTSVSSISQDPFAAGGSSNHAVVGYSIEAALAHPLPL